MKLLITPTAEADLERLGDGNASKYGTWAGTLVRELRLICGVLPGMPRLFPVAERYQQKGVRRLKHGEYTVYYRLTDASVEVLHIRVSKAGEAAASDI